MNEYTCTKCGSSCVIEWDESKCAGGWPYTWCDECNDYPGGFEAAAGDIQADRLSSMIDRATDQAKDRSMGL